MMRRQKLLSTLVLIASLATTVAAQAGQVRENRHGFFGGLDFGTGEMRIEYTKNGHKWESGDVPSASLGLRFGYAFSPRFTLALDARGTGRDDHDRDYGIGSAALVATLYPTGGGFYLRAGLGAAGLSTELPDDVDTTREEAIEKGAGVAAFGLGYEWMMSKAFSLGLGVETRSSMSQDFGDLQDVSFCESSLGLRMNWMF